MSPLSAKKFADEARPREKPIDAIYSEGQTIKDKIRDYCDRAHIHVLYRRTHFTMWNDRKKTHENSFWKQARRRGSHVHPYLNSKH